MVRYYVRVSTFEQKIDRQLTAYDKADFTYIDKMSGVSRDRPELQRLLTDLHAGDIVVVKSLDRLSRSTRDLLDLVDFITSKNAFIKVLDLNIDTSSSFGKFFLTIIAAIAQLERDTIRERVIEGVAIAKAQGKYKGREKGAIKLKGDALKRFVYFYNLGMNVTNLAKEFNTYRPTVYRWIDVLKSRGVIK